MTAVLGIALVLGGIVLAVRNGRLRDALPFILGGVALVLIDVTGVYG
jgi:hypothetical protein